jgi:hypothetical protein
MDTIYARGYYYLTTTGVPQPAATASGTSNRFYIMRFSSTTGSEAPFTLGIWNDPTHAPDNWRIVIVQDTTANPNQYVTPLVTPASIPKPVANKWFSVMAMYTKSTGTVKVWFDDVLIYQVSNLKFASHPDIYEVSFGVTSKWGDAYPISIYGDNFQVSASPIEPAIKGGVTPPPPPPPFDFDAIIKLVQEHMVAIACVGFVAVVGVWYLLPSKDGKKKK